MTADMRSSGADAQFVLANVRRQEAMHILRDQSTKIRYCHLKPVFVRAAGRSQEGQTGCGPSAGRSPARITGRHHSAGYRGLDVHQRIESAPALRVVIEDYINPELTLPPIMKSTASQWQCPRLHRGVAFLPA
jgi:hypothetical protein